MSPEKKKVIEDLWTIQFDALHLLELINAEFKSDPMSVQCFDLRIVKRAEEVCERAQNNKMWIEKKCI